LGVEDVKLFPHNGNILFLGTVEHNGTLTIGKGTYDRTMDHLDACAIESPHGRACEKNWCYCDDALHIVYEWSPLTIYDASMNLVQTSAVPDVFQYVRGSTHGVRVGDEIWFLCHVVDYSAPRQYYHMFVILDRATLCYKHHSILFKFHGDPIEYALGLIVEPERILLSYSRMDRTSAVYVLRRSIVEKELLSR
jgi:hypothetical protein